MGGELRAAVPARREDAWEGRRAGRGAGTGPASRVSEPQRSTPCWNQAAPAMGAALEGGLRTARGWREAGFCPSGGRRLPTALLSVEGPELPEVPRPQRKLLDGGTSQLHFMPDWPVQGPGCGPETSGNSGAHQAGPACAQCPACAGVLPQACRAAN